MEEFGGFHFNFFKTILEQVAEITGKGQGVVKSRGLQFFKQLFFYMGPSVGGFLKGLSKFQVEEIRVFMEENKSRSNWKAF